MKFIKKISAILLSTLLLAGGASIVEANFSVPWAATSTTQGWVFPIPINGTYPSAIAPVFIATSTTASSTFYGGLSIPNGGFQVSSINQAGAIRCLQIDAAGNFQTANAACGSGGGGSGGGTWSTTTSSVAGQLINYPNNNTDIVAIGNSATTTAKFYFDPNIVKAVLSGLTVLTNATSSKLTVTGPFFDNAGSAGTAGYVLMSTGNGLAWTATSSINNGVTSVNGSGGTTGLTLTGGPITTTGTLTLGGTLGISNGGTNATTIGASSTVALSNGTGYVFYKLTPANFTNANVSQWTNDAGYITGNQSITLSGDVSGSGTTAITTAIGANKVTYSQIQQVAANSLIGNPTGATANAQAIATSSLGLKNTDISGLGTLSTLNSVNNSNWSGTQLSVSNGGTGQTSLLSGQLLYGSGTGAVQSVATTTASCSGSTSCSTFTIIGSSPVTISSTGGGGSGNVATSTGETAGNLAYWTSTNATPATLGKIATTTITCSTGLNCPPGSFVAIGSSPVSISNSGVINFQQQYGSSQAGTITLSTSSQTTNGLTAGLNITNLLGTFTLAPTISGTLTVAGGGTGQTSFKQGWLGINDSGAFISSTSPTVSWLTATSTTAHSTFPYASTTAITASTASTTALIVSNLGSSGTTCVQAGADGTLSSTGSACGAGGGAAFPFTPTTNFGQAANSTTTALWLKGSPYSLFASSTAYLTYASSTAVSATTLCLTGDICRTTWPTASVSGGTAGMITSWIDGTTLTATSGPTAAYYTATSTSATSTFAGSVTLGNNALIENYAAATTSVASLETGYISTDPDPGVVQVINAQTVNAASSTLESLGFGFNSTATSSINIFGKSNGVAGQIKQFDFMVATSTQFDARDTLTVGGTNAATTTYTFIPSSGKACFNTVSDTGSVVSFYIHGTSFVIEANACK